MTWDSAWRSALSSRLVSRRASWSRSPMTVTPGLQRGDHRLRPSPGGLGADQLGQVHGLAVGGGARVEPGQRQQVADDGLAAGPGRPAAPPPVRRQSASAGYSMASSTWTRMAVIGLRRSCEASATNLRCRSTACSSRLRSASEGLWSPPATPRTRSAPPARAGVAAQERPARPGGRTAAPWPWPRRPASRRPARRRGGRPGSRTGRGSRAGRTRRGYGRRCRRRAPAGSWADGRSGSPSWTPRARPGSRPGSRPPRC